MNWDHLICHHTIKRQKTRIMKIKRMKSCLKELMKGMKDDIEEDLTSQDKDLQ